MNKCIVLIPHFNNPCGLVKSIKSINENQDVLIVDDGSKIAIDEKLIIKNFSGVGKIFFKYLKTNRGIESALNHGLNFILKMNRHEYIARLDCGDKNVNNRITNQIKFLDDHRNVYLVGSFVDFIDQKGMSLFKVEPPTNHVSIRKNMFLNCMFIHPSVMFRTEVIHLVGTYPVNYQAAEDYAFFFKIVNKYETANIPEILVNVDANPDGISANKRKIQVFNRIRIIIQNFHFGFYPIYGLLRNLALYILPLSLVNFIKKNFHE